MTSADLFARRFAECPLVAILRGVAPEEVESIGAALIEAGVRVIEVPLNSPAPITSITRLSARFGEEALIGAGTVIDVADVGRVADAGGRLIVAPNTDPRVIRAARAAGLAAAPGYLTPSEAFTAIEAGANALKLFPAEAAPPAVVKAQRAVLPSDVPLIVVGGIKTQSIAGYRKAGADGFGIGGALYTPGLTAAQVAARARAFVAAVQEPLE